MRSSPFSSFRSCIAIASTTVALAAGFNAHAEAEGGRAPSVPPEIAVRKGNHVHFHGFGRGVQIYTWDGSSWGAAVPEATLFDSDGNAVANHFAGPTWEESNRGSKVVGAVVPPRIIVDPDAIPWLLLMAVSTEGHGIFADTTFIQRINTTGGKAPAANGSATGQVARVPYTADYYFYRKNRSHQKDGRDGFYQQRNLVSDQPGVALVQDTNLVNPWGISFSPASTFWVNDNGRGLATLYAVTNDSSGSPHVAKQNLEVRIPGEGNPTGQLFNNTTNFHGDVFLFVSEDGVISGWRGALGTTAEVLATRPNAIYKGVTLTSVAGVSFLLAANFSEGTVDVYDGNANLVGQLADSHAPRGYAPFNVQSLEGMIFVTFARQDADKKDDVPGRGHGLIDVLNLQTQTFQRFVTGSDAGGHFKDINSPWGIAVAPNTFGRHADRLLVGNFGSGTIMAFDEHGHFEGFLENPSDRPVVIPNLWALTFGSGVKAGVPGTLYFTSGPDDERHGLFGSLEPAGGQGHDQDDDDDRDHRQ